MNENLGTAFAFPGMGIRLTGFERALFIRHRERMLPFLTEASDTAGKDLVSVLEHDTVAGQDLDDRNSQIFTFAFSAALFEVLMDNGVSAHYMAGYSFGHYAALFATHCLPFSAALSCAGRAYDIMRESCPDGRWGMAVVVGLPQAEMEDLLTGSITLVNVNSDTCVILAGSVDDLGLLRGRAMDRGALRAEMLPVTIPYHSPAILSNASEKLRTYLKTLPWNAPAVPIVSSLDQGLLADSDHIIDYTVKHLCTPINWLKTMGRLRTLGITRIIECGPGVSLSRHGTFMPYDILYVNVKTIRRTFAL